MKKEYFVSDEVWNYRFLWIEKEFYLDSKRKKLFVEQMNNYPNMDDSLSSEDRQEKYLIADIEKHGRLVEIDFLQRIYPDSWAEAWVTNDLVKV